jgi:RHS repeat-associated protein
MAMKKTYYSVSGELLGEKAAGGQRIDYLTDALGSVTATVDQTGTVLNRYVYKPYGALLAKTGVATDPAFTWVGNQGYRQTAKKYSDVYIRARHDDTVNGRWTTKDPIGFSGEDWNVYRFVQDTPTTQIDPTGQLSVQIGVCDVPGARYTCSEAGDRVSIASPGGRVPPSKAVSYCPGGATSCGNGEKCIVTNGGFFHTGTGEPLGAVRDCKGVVSGGISTCTYDLQAPRVSTGQQYLAGRALFDRNGKCFKKSKCRPGDKEEKEVIPDQGIRRPRTAVCQTRDRTCILTVPMPGMTASELCACMSTTLKCPTQNSINMDGGGSTTWCCTDPKSALKCPISEKKDEPRPVANFIVICGKGNC